MEKYDFSGWATRNNVKCSDGRTIMKDAFKHCDGQKVPLVWAHQHDKPENTLGHAILENREEGVYAYCSFNDTTNGELAKTLVKHGDITALSIFANQLKQDSSKRVMHGYIREVSLVHAGANPEAFIENVIVHSEDGEFVRELEDEVTIYTGENFTLYHAEEEQAVTEQEEVAEDATEQTETGELAHEQTEEKEPEAKESENKETESKENGKTVKEVWDGITKKLDDEEMNLVYGMIAAEAETTENQEIKHSEGGNDIMKSNVFEQNGTEIKNEVLTHADREAIVALSKQPGVGSLQAAIKLYASDNEKLAHAFDQSDAETVALLFPEPHLLNPGTPEIIRDQEIGWVSKVINKIHKSPFAKIRTRKADARATELKAKGYQKKGDEKKIMNQIKLLKRETAPQTVYVKDELHRDDIIDIDWDITAFQWNVMKDTMNETLALAALVGDRRDDTDPDKIHEANIRSIYNDEDFYCMHYDVDIEAAKYALQGENTNLHFGENYIYAEAMVTASLYSREKFKGTGLPTCYCTPHFVNVMLLARDMNGRRIYDSKADLAKALNVAEIVEIEQLEGVTRTQETATNNSVAGDKELLALFVNLADYTFGCAKGGQLTRFEDFDIDYNKYKYLLETRLSGSLTEPYSAIALEMPLMVHGS